MVLGLAWLIVAITGKLEDIAQIEPGTWLFLILSGLATGVSWICYFKALSLGDVNKVTPVDKSSAALASLLAIIIFGELSHLAIKLVCITIILIGTYMMIEPSKPASRKTRDAKSARVKESWILYAVLAAVFAALTSILGKVGIENVDSNLGTAIRTVAVLLCAWGIVFAKGKVKLVPKTSKSELGFLILSGLATGASWLLYYFAIRTGVVSIVVQIDKLSVVVAVIFSICILHEHLSCKAVLGLILLTAATLLMTTFAS